MEKKALTSMVEEAARRLFANQPNIFEFTSATGQTEWNLAHHLASELHDLVPELDCDLDVAKRNFENRRPDIILHKRGTHSSNLLVIEVKRDGTRAELERDMAKVADNWFQLPLRYQFGAVVDLRSDKSYTVAVFENDAS